MSSSRIEKRQAFTVPPQERWIRNSAPFRQFFQWNNLAFMANPDSSPLISGLRGHRGPIAISSIVIPVDISAFKAMSGRTRTHVRKEPLKRVMPRRVHGYASRAVVLISRMLWAKASGNGRVPRGVLCGLRQAVLGHSCDQIVSVKTSATAREALAEISSCHDRGSTAITDAVPLNAGVRRLIVTDGIRYEPTEPLPGNILQVLRPSTARSMSNNPEFASRTATAFDVTTNEIGTKDYFGFAAIAETLPSARRDIRQGDEFPEPLSSQISEVIRWFDKVVFSHAAHPPMVSGCGQARFGSDNFLRAACILA